MCIRWIEILVKGVLKARIHIRLYESDRLQEQDAVLLFLSVTDPMRGGIVYCYRLAQLLVDLLQVYLVLKAYTCNSRVFDEVTVTT